MWGLIVEGPASTCDIRRIETDLGIGLPPALSRFFSECSRSRDFRWQLPRDFLRPKRFFGLFGGGFSLSLEALPENERRRLGGELWEFPNPDDPYDAVWHQKFGVMPVPNGDCIGIDLRPAHEGEVVYPMTTARGTDTCSGPT